MSGFVHQAPRGRRPPGATAIEPGGSVLSLRLRRPITLLAATALVGASVVGGAAAPLAADVVAGTVTTSAISATAWREQTFVTSSKWPCERE